MAIPDGPFSDGDEGTADLLNSAFVQFDTRANQPAASAANKGMFYISTDDGGIDYSDGSSFVVIRGADMSQAQAEAGTDQVLRGVTAERIAQAIAEQAGVSVASTIARSGLTLGPEFTFMKVA